MIDRRSWRRIIAAGALSGAVHASFILFGRIELPGAPEDLPPLAVRLVEQPAPTARVTPAPMPHQRAPKRPRVHADVARSEPTQPVPVAADPALISAADAPAAVTAPADPEVAPKPEVIATAPASAPPAAVAEPLALPAFPRRGRIAFTLVYGRDGFPVGRTEQSWQIDGTRYQLASRSETTGLVNLLRAQHRTYLSRGELTPKGLKPQIFLMSRDRGRGSEEARAAFHWDRGSITLGSAATPREEPLPPDAQDLVSFMYQLALTPPAPGRMRVAVTNGSRIESYDLDVLPEEKIETPLGVMRVLPVSQVKSAGSESIDLWLAVEYRYLPVRIRFYGRDGEAAGEQIVSEIRLAEE